MNQKAIDRYFKELSKHFHHPCRILLTGAGAGVIMGHVRATMDVDFAVRFTSKKNVLWSEFEKAVSLAKQKTQISAQYAQDIDRWSAITYLDYERHTKKYRTFGPIKIEMLDPLYWAIGKLTRFLDSDIQDLVIEFKKQSVSWRKLAPLLGLALKKSPKSDACGQFKKQVEYFFYSSGPTIWKKNYDPSEALSLFHQSAGMKT